MTEPGDAPPAGARRIEVAASFWSTPRERVAAEADRLARAGLQLVHWDHTDGDYAAAGGFTAVEAEAVTLRTGLFAEGHLMVRCPLREIDAWTGFCVRVAVHAGTIDWRAAVDRIRSRGIRAAVAVAGGEPVPELDHDVDVLVMSITPGQAGSTFRPAALETVATLATGRRNVGLDGGVTRAILPPAQQAGATWLVSGTDLTGARDPAAWLAAAHGV